VIKITLKVITNAQKESLLSIVLVRIFIANPHKIQIDS